LWKQKNQGVGAICVVNEVVNGGRIEGRTTGKHESVESSRIRSSVERKSTIKDWGLPCNFILFFMCEALIEEILFPIATCCVYVFLGVIPWFKIVVSYNNNKRIRLWIGRVVVVYIRQGKKK
jgi:hypothetical protein